MAGDQPKPSSAPLPDPAAPVPARDRRSLPLATTVGVLVALGLNLALCWSRSPSGARPRPPQPALRRGRQDLAFVGLSHLNLLLLFLSLRRFDRTLPGSAARGRAMLAVWLLTATLTAAFTWKIGALMPLAFAVAAWVMAAATVLGGFCVLFLLHGDK